jgi:hypothetical protein
MSSAVVVVPFTPPVTPVLVGTLERRIAPPPPPPPGP